ncbi:MAG: DUF4276 family protein [bacterium]|nr:DUF4276 family protein [bacterium]
MKRVHVLVEGQTEETFVRDVLWGHLQASGVHVTAIIATTKRLKSGRKFKGGVAKYQQIKRDIQRLLADRSAAAVTTMIDYYGLPADFPGRGTLTGEESCYERVKHLEREMRADIRSQRFLPYLSLHEFEALLLTSPRHFAATFQDQQIATHLTTMLDSVISPEEINDDPITHPSARINQLVPGYKKRLHGPMIAGRIGLNAIRQRCPHFDRWVTSLERLGRSAGPQAGTDVPKT